MSRYILFGCGSGLEKVVSALNYDKSNIVVGLFDNDTDKQGNKLYNIIIDNPSNINNYEYDYVVICSVYYEEISNQLRKLNVDDSNIIPFYKIDNTIETLKKLLLMLNGELLKDARGMVQVKLPKVKFPLYLRENTSDIFVFRQIFINHEYEFDYHNVEGCVIIDGGANIGLASIYFANVFKKCNIISIEPENENYEMLKLNTKYYNSIHTYRAALWNEEKEIEVLDKGYGAWGYMVEENNNQYNYLKERVKAITVQNLLRLSKNNRIGILKLDIEGSEKELFEKNYEQWLSSVNYVAIELHDDFREGCSKSFYKAISKYKFNKFQNGENLIFERII